MTGVTLDIQEKHYKAQSGTPARQIFRDFHLAVEPHSFVVLLGPSGIGKTTLLNMVAGLDGDYRGSVAFTSPTSAGTVRPRIGYAFQSPRLLPWRTVLENVMLPLSSGGANLARGKTMLAEVGLADAADAYPERLSLGQQRRVALARAFVIEPDVLLMDEPFVSLDEASAARLRSLLRMLLKRRAATVMFVTHNSREAVELASRIVSLDGSPARIVRDVPVALTATERESSVAIEAFKRLNGMNQRG